MKMVSAIFAEDPILRAETLKEIVDALVEPADRVFDVKELSGETASAFDIVTALENYPVGDGHRVVVVTEAQRLSSDAAGKIVAALPEIPDFSVLVLVVDSSSQAKLPAKLKTAAKDNTYVIGGATKQDKAEVAAKYVKKLFDTAGMKVSASIVSSIIGRVGTECLALRGEVMKVMDFAWTPQGYREVTETMLDSLIAETEDDVTFRLVDALSQQDLTRSVELLKDRLEHTADTKDGEAFRLLALVRRQFLLLSQTKTLLDRRIDVSSSPIPGDEPMFPDPKYDLREVLKRNSWQAKKLVPVARRMSWSSLTGGLMLISQLEEMMKNPEGMISDPEAVMSYGVMKLCA